MPTISPPSVLRATASARKFTAWAVLALCSAANVQAQLVVPAVNPAADYAIDPAHTHVQWEVRHFGTSTSRGRFDDITGSIRLDRAAHKGEVSITIATGTVSSGVAPLDSILRGPDFLHAKTYPNAYFVASAWKLDAQGGAELRGEFTLRDVSRPLTLRALHFNCYQHPTLAREVCGGDFEAELLRSDFGITYGLPFVGDKVRLLIQIEAVRLPS